MAELVSALDLDRTTSEVLSLRLDFLDVVFRHGPSIVLQDMLLLFEDVVDRFFEVDPVLAVDVIVGYDSSPLGQGLLSLCLNCVLECFESETESELNVFFLGRGNLVALLVVRVLVAHRLSGLSF